MARPNEIGKGFTGHRNYQYHDREKEAFKKSLCEQPADTSLHFLVHSYMPMTTIMATPRMRKAISHRLCLSVVPSSSSGMTETVAM